MSGAPEITRQNIATYNVISPVGAEVMDEAKGRYRGENVSVSSETSKVQDAAEELGMSVAHLSSKKSLGQRTIRQGQGANLEAISRIQDYYDKLPNMPRETQLKSLMDQLSSFQDLLERQMGGGGGPTKEDVLAALQRFDGDVTHQYAALELARDYFAATGGSAELQTLLDQARSEFERGDLGRDVRAGFAVAEVASRAAATLETDPGTVRDMYRAMLRETPSFGQLFDGLAKLDVMKTFKEAIETFMQAAGRDLASTGPSSDPTFLHGLLTELGKLKKMQTTFDAVGQLVRTTERQLPAGERGRGDVVDLTSRVLNFASKATVNAGDAGGLLGGFSQKSLGTQITYANGLRALHGEIPDDVMPSPQARLQQNTTILLLLDRLVAAEEAEYAEEEDEKEKKKREERALGQREQRTGT